MKRFFLLLCGVLGAAVLTPAAAQAPAIKVQPRMNYFTEADSAAQLIVTGPHVPTAKMGRKNVPLTPVPNNRTDAQTYALPLSALAGGDNMVQVKIGDSTCTVRLTKLPAKANSVQIDYLTGMIHTGGLPFIPCGFYCYSPVQPTIAEEEVVRGMNLISPYQNIGGQPREERIAYLDRAAQLGMRVNYNLLSIAGGGGGARAAATDKQEKMNLLREEIRAVKDHPAILSWYVADEPDGQGISAETLEEIYDIIREVDPYHPVSVVIMSAGPGREYAASCDIIMTDPYPVPNSPAAEAVTTVAALTGELRYEKAIWMVPQTFGGAEWWPREPTPAEIRMMTWGGALGGARGFQAFIRNGLNGFPKNQYMWETYTKACREIQELTPFFDRGGEFVHTSPSATPGVEARSYKLGSQMVTVIINTAPKEGEYSFVLPEVFSGTAYNLSDNSRKEVRNARLEGYIAPFEVIVLKMFGDSSEEAAFLGDNKVGSVSNMLLDPGFEWEYSVSGNVPAAVYGGIGKDRGATYAIDSRVSYQGGHSLRLHTPEADKGCRVSFYPLPLQLGKSYIMTVWAKADPESLKSQSNGGPMTFRMNLGGIEAREFELTSEWQRYELSTVYSTAARDVRALTCTLELLGEGTAWFDMAEVVPDMDFTVEEHPSLARSFRVTMNNHIEGGTIHYTLDGSEPTQQSPVYTGPLTITDVRTVKARVFGADGRSYGITEQLVAAHKGIGAEVTYNAPYTKYTGGGSNALVDGRVGAVRFTDPAWQGYIGNDLDVVIDLQEPTRIEKITSQYLHSRGDWIMPPTRVEYLLSVDGEQFESVGTVELGQGEDKPAFKVSVPVEGIDKTARYIRVKATGHGKMPAWHSKDDAWMFIDEVIIE